MDQTLVGRLCGVGAHVSHKHKHKADKERQKQHVLTVTTKRCVYNGVMHDVAHTPLGMVIERGSPPSSYCALAVVENQQGAIPKFLLATLLRSLIIAPGLLAVGVRGKQAVFGALAGSTCISGVLLLYYGWHHNQQMATGRLAPWHADWPGFHGAGLPRT